MQKEFQDWLIRLHENMPKDNKSKFLKLLKESPETVVQIVRGNVEQWSVMAAFELKMDIFSYNEQDCATSLVEAFKKHFQAELKLI